MTNTYLTNSFNRSPLRRDHACIGLALVCLALSPTVRAIYPPPEGGYSNGNTALGTDPLFYNTTGSFNTAKGVNALFSNTTGAENTANGGNALLSNTYGGDNTADGFNALKGNVGGLENTACGAETLRSNTFGSNNTALGILAGAQITGNSNIDIGNEGVAGESNTIRIGRALVHTKTFIAGITGVVIASGSAVVVDANGRLGTRTSSERFKEGIKPMDKASEAVLALQPVTFQYKKEFDPDGIPQFGLVAEQVEKVNPALVARDADGKVNTVRYEAINAMLLNEFLKQYRKSEEQESRLARQEEMIARQQQQIEALTAGLQRVTVQIKSSKSAPRIATSN